MPEEPALVPTFPIEKLLATILSARLLSPLFRANEITNEVVERKSPGRDGAQSQHIIERDNGEAISRTHRVTKDGEVIHQHQDHIGKHGGTRSFNDNWTGTKTIK